jgi:hypothetical protein
MEDVCILYGHLVNFMDIWSILWTFGLFSSVLVRCTEKNLATLREIFFFLFIFGSLSFLRVPFFLRWQLLTTSQHSNLFLAIKISSN